ncbi:hypothetical protein QFC19_005754 [Naganishia cerealis]|uniref:Uncharacterized protein n=1 Tax=Naganishia cerealis TaxID=610337 RepID=A0ACC2VKX9_9TREE|nr:hypothetical protein QFC19_005754 [Naganishia cerealis]
MLFSRRSLAILFKTPVVPAVSTQPASVELSTMVSSSRPRAVSRTYSTAPLSARPVVESRMSSANAMRFAPSSSGRQQQQSRGYASDKGKMELYSDEEGSIGAGIDDVAKSDAAFNSETNPHKAAKQVEQDVSLFADLPLHAAVGTLSVLYSGTSQTGKSMQKTPANEDYSRPINPPAETSKSAADANGGFEKNQ